MYILQREKKEKHTKIKQETGGKLHQIRQQNCFFTFTSLKMTKITLHSEIGYKIAIFFDKVELRSIQQALVTISVIIKSNIAIC